MATGSTGKKHRQMKYYLLIEFISCEQNGICPVTNGLQKMLKQPTITVNV
jgi:hypothetical protein